MMENDYATVYNVVDRWCNRSKALSVSVSTTDDRKHAHKKADYSHADISLFSKDKSRIYIILDYNKSESRIDTSMIFLFSDGFRMLKKVKKFLISSQTDIDMYEKRVINPALNELLNSWE